MEAKDTSASTAGNATHETPAAKEASTEKNEVPALQVPAALALPTEDAEKTAVSQSPEIPPIRIAPRVEENQEEKAVTALYGGNAVAAAQNALQRQDSDEKERVSLDRNLREVGIKEALPHKSEEPARAILEEETEEGTKRVRTYAADISEEIRKRGATLSSIVVAEKTRAVASELGPDSEIPKKRWLWILGAGVLVVFGIAVIAGVYIFRSSQGTAPAVTENIIPINEKKTLAWDGHTPLATVLGKEKLSATLALGDVEEIDVTQNGVPLTAEQILTALNAPNELARNATNILVGVHAFNHNQPFLIVSVSAYDHAFHAMLSWEGTVGDALGNFFAPANSEPSGVATRAPVLTFTDAVSANIDVRESQPAWEILYGFPRQDLLIITTNESTLRELLTRLSLQNTSGG